MRAQFVANGLGGGSHTALFQSYWRPGTGAGSTADATDILARIRAALNACATVLHNSINFVASADVVALNDATGAITGSFAGAVPATVFGTAVGDAMPPQTAWIVKSVTNLVVGPRLLKGRVFLPGPSEGQNTATGAPITGSVTTINAAFTGLLTGGATASFPVVWHRPGGAGLAVGTSSAVTAFQVQPTYWGSQRGRRFH
jgi:hypothetical protein